MIVLDASVLIAHLDARDEHHEDAESLLEQAGAEPFGASTVTLAETLVGPARAGRLEDALGVIETLGVIELELGRGSARTLAGLRTDTGCRMPDCCVLAAAITHEGTVATFDRTLRREAAKLGLKTLPASS